MTLEQGESFELKVTPDPYVTVRYAGASGDFNPIHIDEEFARSVGLPGRILHGLWTMAQVARAHTDAGGGPQALKRLTVQFRAEIFNLLNRANFNTPNLIVFTPTGVSGTAGAITSTSTTSRQVQFALKLLW